MTDHDALLRAICENPDDDTPRLIFADWLDEDGQAERAAFVRAQVALAATPSWEPHAAVCRHRRPEWRTGIPFRGTLPPLNPFNAEWMTEPFRRGLGWRVQVKVPGAWVEVAPRLFDSAPVGELYLHTGTIDDWRAFAAAEWVRHLRSVAFVNSPIEPVREISHSPAATGIHEMRFRRCSGAAIDLVVDDLLATPVGRGLRRLHFHNGSATTLGYLVDVLAASGGPHLERLSFTSMLMTGEFVRRLCAGRGTANLKELAFRGEPLGDGLVTLATDLPGAKLDTLVLSSVGLEPGWLEPFAASDRFPALRRLDLSDNRLPPRSTRILQLSWSLAGLRMLKLKKCGIGDKGVKHLVDARFWPNLVELDLRQNPVSGAGAKHLLAAAVPRDLTALVLDARGLDGSARAALRRRFGEAVVFSEGEPVA